MHRLDLCSLLAVRGTSRRLSQLSRTTVASSVWRNVDNNARALALKVPAKFVTRWLAKRVVAAGTPRPSAILCEELSQFLGLPMHTRLSWFESLQVSSP